MIAPIRLAVLLTAILAVSGSGIELTQAGGRVATESPEARRAEALFQEALSLSATRERQAAKAQLLEAIRLWTRMREPERAARAALQMGDSYVATKAFHESLYYYKQALEIDRVPVSVQAVAFSSIARVYDELYLDDLATHYYDRAINLARAAKDVSTRAGALRGLAAIDHRLGQTEQAIARISEARNLNRQQGDDNAEAALLHLTGLIHQEQGKLVKARESIELASNIYRKKGNEDGYIMVLCSISALDLASGLNRGALDNAEQAVRMAEGQRRLALTLPDILRVRELRFRAWLSLARAQRALGQVEKATISYFRATSEITALWLSTHTSTENSAVAFREERQAPYRELVDLLVEQGKFEEAFEQTEYAQSRAMLGLMEARRVSDLPRNMRENASVREMSRTIAGLRTRWLSPEISSAERVKLQTDIRYAELALKEAYSRAEMEGRKERMGWFKPASIKQLQEGVIRENETLLKFFLGEKRSFVWLVSSNAVAVEVLPGRQEIENAVGKYLSLASVPPSNLHIERDLSRVDDMGRDLYSTLLARLSNRIAADTGLIIAPDGILHYLPFEALVRDGRYLIRDHKISYVSSASLLSQLRAGRNQTEAKDRMDLLAFGDSLFELSSKTPSKIKPHDSPDHVVRDARVSSGFSFAPLPRTRDEVQHIAGLFPADRRQVYLGRDSSEDSVKREQLRRYRRLHFATHGLVDERNPWRSAVVLTLDNDPEEDGFLEMNEISELELDCDLVVLSACQTGRGRLFSGEGIMGLSRAFLYAGARSVVVTLWSVTDISAGQLMKGFYGHLIGGVSNDAALRQAKLQMLESCRETKHPYYWAAFVVVGNP